MSERNQFEEYLNNQEPAQISISEFNTAYQAASLRHVPGTDIVEVVKGILAEVKEGNTDYIIMGKVLIVRGEIDKIALTNKQTNAIYSLYGVSVFSNNVGRSVICEARNKATANQIQARMIMIENFRGPTDDHIIISQSLANKLGLQNEEQIVLQSVFYDISQLNLDEFK